MLEQILAQTPPVDAIFFCNDDLAPGAPLTAARKGIDVSKRIAIAGFNDHGERSDDPAVDDGTHAAQRDWCRSRGAAEVDARRTGANRFGRRRVFVAVRESGDLPLPSRQPVSMRAMAAIRWNVVGTTRW